GQFEATLVDSASSLTPQVEIAREGLLSHLKAEGVTEPTARFEAISVYETLLHNEATSLAFQRIFAIFGLALVVALPLLVFMRKNPDPGAKPAAGH
ncbi:MAG: hypothetical protein ACQKBV_08705, partial [Puniceicoccales bacterium]